MYYTRFDQNHRNSLGAITCRQIDITIIMTRGGFEIFASIALKNRPKR